MKATKTYILDGEIVERLESYCKQNNKSYSETVNEAVKRYLDEEEAK